MIRPTIGRIVHFYPFGAPQDSSVQPHAAIVTFVHSDRLINVCAHNERGVAYPMTSVQLLQDDDEAPSNSGYACWMDYQKEQASRS